MTVLSAEGITVELPAGWEGAIGHESTRDDGSVRNVVAHFASFPLPPRRGDFGGGAVDLMGPDDVFITLFDYGRRSAATELFAAEGLPSPIEASHFDRSMLQKPLPRQSAVQRFFTAGGRALCLYIVVGSHTDRADVLPAINRLLSSMSIR